MNPVTPASGRPDESLEQLFGSVFDLAGQFATQISQDEIEARLRRILREARRPAEVPRAAPASPEVALVTRAAAGDREAWNQIVDSYAPLVSSICRRYQLTRQDMEDVAQAVWLLLVDRIDTLRTSRVLPGWLATTTRRECLRVLGRERRAGPSAMPPEDLARLVDDATIDAEILAAERNAALQTAFAGLSPVCQQLLAMLLADPPFSYAQISATLDIPVGSIGPQRARCLNWLRRAITSDEPDRTSDR